MGWEHRGNPGPQPRASNMRAVEWDPELELLANRWAAQCGQSIAMGNFALNNDLSFIVNWYDNVEMFDKNDILNYGIKYENRYPSPSQYAQLVWAETYQIGCARVAFQRANGSDVSYKEHFICNYGPTGNIPGQRMYKIGEPCSECPDGTACDTEYPGLCGSEASYDVVYERQLQVKVHQIENVGEKIHLSVLVGVTHLFTTIVSYLIEQL
ncbi:hypothetical protein NQ314_001303 [Rhamnusium bicolor]|uniref:SCP domain-containing protein n=1 Tax=Rhamnusium bicolor TaxID=1586634 RepID=A0AAV8ZTK8_9CUCU|nr:hypothetical protein NQ314_001303 [Rhamnusium bicolor]